MVWNWKEDVADRRLRLGQPAMAEVSLLSTILVNCLL